MKIDTAGTYTLRYTATDECGNVGTKDCTLNVIAITYRTVLYADGTFIINEKSSDQARNEALHGSAQNVYIPFDPNGTTNTERYVFGSLAARPWDSRAYLIKSVIVGSPIEPTRTSYWFSGTACNSWDFTNLLPTNFADASYMFSGCSGTNLDASTLDTSNVTNMQRMFANCSNVTQLHISNLDTHNVTSMNGMFAGVRGGIRTIDLSSFDTTNLTNCGDMFAKAYYLTVIDLSSFDTSKVTNMWAMFDTCQQLTTIYASESFVTDLVTSRMSTDMFKNNTDTHRIVGGAGTRWASSNPTDKTYARIDNPPDAPGYFTAKA